MAQAKSKRRSRKRRKPGQAPKPAQAARPRAAQRREARAERQIQAEREERRSQSTLGVYGERPQSVFAPLPVSEVAIFAGGVGVIVALVSGATAPLVVGIIVCTLGVIEVTAREHFSGYRSHATLLAGIPAIGIGVVMIAVWGSTLARATLLLVVVPLFAVLLWALRKRFRTARQARIVRPPAP